MSIEEKAKSYDKALESATIAYKDEDRHLKATLERIFPELKGESEDERISKEIIKYLEQTVPHNHRDEVLKSKEWIAWLEKQGEQTLLNDNNKKYHRVSSTTLKRLYMNEAKYELLKEDITDGYIDTFVKEGSHNYLKIKIPMILCPTNCKKGDKVKLIIVKEE